MATHDDYKAGQKYAEQYPSAQKATEQQIPNSEQRIAFNNGMDSKK